MQRRSAAVRHAGAVPLAWRLQQQFDDSNWAEEINGEKHRVALIKRAFDDFSKENGGRAVRKEAPLEQEILAAR